MPDRLIELPLSAIDALDFRSTSRIGGRMEVTRGPETIARLEIETLRERGRITAGGSTYLCRARGIPPWSFELRGEEGLIASARRGLTFRRVAIAAGERELVLETDSWSWSPLWLREGSATVGRVERTSARGRSGSAELAADLPEPVKLLIIFLATLAWRRFAGLITDLLIPR
jgi:hypothetical protein